MRFLVQQYSKTIDLTNKDKKKTSSFRIIKGKNGEVHQIKGTTHNGKSYLVEEDIKKKNEKTGLVISKHKLYKIKSSNMMNLLKEGKKTKESTKKIILKKPVKKVDTKKVDTKKLVKKVDTKKLVKKVDTKKTVKKVDTKKAVKKVDSKKPIKKVGPKKKSNLKKFKKLDDKIKK
jgi:hypothetical protein